MGWFVGAWMGCWEGGQWEKGCLGCISETIRCRKLKLGRNIDRKGWGVVGVGGGGGV